MSTPTTPLDDNPSADIQAAAARRRAWKDGTALRIQRFASSGLCKVWLIESIGGGANSGFLHGITSEEKAIELATALNIPHTITDAGVDYAAGELQAREREQGVLFSTEPTPPRDGATKGK